MPTASKASPDASPTRCAAHRPHFSRTRRRRSPARTLHRGPPLQTRGPGTRLDMDPPPRPVFCRTRGSRPAHRELNARGYRAEALHGGMSQEQRDRVMARLRGGNRRPPHRHGRRRPRTRHRTSPHVVSTMCRRQRTYVHRIGRVGRATGRGVAITLVEPGTPDAQNHSAQHERPVSVEKLPPSRTCGPAADPCCAPRSSEGGGRRREGVPRGH